MRRRFTLCQQVALKVFPRCKHMLSLSAALLVLIGSLFTAVQSSMYCWSNLISQGIGLFRLWGRVRHIYKLNNWSNLWISAYWRCGPFETIQFYLVNWFVWRLVHEPDITSKQAVLPLWTLICIIQRQYENKTFILKTICSPQTYVHIKAYPNWIAIPLASQPVWIVTCLNRFSTSSWLIVTSLGLGDVCQIGIGRCVQWNIVMDYDIRGRG